MEIVNRGYILVTPKEAFITWANQHDEDFEDLTQNEGSIYLIEDDFYDDEPVLKSHFKRIFENELLAVTEDEETYPKITFENFNEMFDCQLGSMVFDALKSDLKCD